MQFQFNSDNQITGDQDTAQLAESIVRSRLGRLETRLTRIELHVSDVNGPRGGQNDKRCLIEARPNGMDPISATDQGETVEAAITGAADKLLTVFDRLVGRQTSRKGH
ncbi:HPF/RaiA family ribosome-associated protein [Sphingorhabdus sp.]|uniref:HPF/RaiA family ribosome-associated protein n=1 Tax=Sphingorhabdus sp. TaxID=1902408 RepID=UPI00391AEF78